MLIFSGGVMTCFCLLSPPLVESPAFPFYRVKRRQRCRGGALEVKFCRAL
jgi:hypothetical protein